MNTISNILESIKKQSEIFLEDTISTQVINTQTSSNIYENTVLVDLSDANININIILSVDNILVQQIYYQLLNEDINEPLNEKIYKSLIDEVINIIVGLSIKDFSTKYQNLVLSIPYRISKDKLLNIINLKSQNFEIVTSNGLLVCYIIEK